MKPLFIDVLMLRIGKFLDTESKTAVCSQRIKEKENGPFIVYWVQSLCLGRCKNPRDGCS